MLFLSVYAVAVMFTNLLGVPESHYETATTLEALLAHHIISR
jgi:hypothetical protein